MCGVPGVVSVHDLHAWTITSGMPSLSAHVTVEPTPFERGKGEEILTQLNVCLQECFEIGHTTFQLETVEQSGSEADIHP